MRNEYPKPPPSGPPPLPPSAPPPPPQKDAKADAEKLQATAQMLAADFDTFQTRARAWVPMPSFLENYRDLHPGILLKLLAGLFGTAKGMKMRDAKLLAEYRKLETEGELRFAASMICNTSLSSMRRMRVPAAVVAADQQDVATVVRVAQFADKLAEAYLFPKKTMPECERLIADDTYQPLRRRPLPPGETGGLAIDLFDIRISADELSEGASALPFLPLLVMPRSGVFVVVPWPIIFGKPFVSRWAPRTPKPPASSS